MRVTFVLPHAGLAGGIRVCAIYAKALQARGHQVHVVSTPKPPPTSFRKRVKAIFKGPKAAEPGHFDNVNVPHTVIDRWRPIVDTDLPDADVVIATWWETAEWVAALSPRKGKKAYFVQHDERFVGQPSQRVEATFKLPMHRITIAKWLVDLARGSYGVDQIDLVPNGVDIEHFSAPPRNKQKLATIGLMYATAQFKGVDIALEAYKNAARNVANLRLITFGQHHPTDQLPLPAGAGFTYRPAQEKIPEIYASCDAWLFASRSEGFGLPILEAMACRTPVIGTPTGAAPELIALGGGVLVKPQDPIDMARAIERVCRLPQAEWKALSDAAHATAQVNTWEKSTELFEQSLLRAAE
ncbi:MAG TPA: glycosyltransferase family 4 protein [Tepidisphaeraceae bacterium]|jgi:glycosyltransferase involved in cell wall biosynthesis